MIQKEDLENDLLRNLDIIHKCKSSISYAQNLYASMCNNRFFKNDQEWTSSWRYSGGLIAEIRDMNEDYMDFYCSGIASDNMDGFVSESFVTTEIRNDLLKMGWIIKPYDN